MRGIAVALLLTGVGAAPAAADQAPPSDSQSMTAQAVQALDGQSVELVAPFTALQKLVCTWAQDRQRARCGARVAEATMPSAEDYLQIYVATDNAEFERDKTAIDKVAGQAPERYRTTDGASLSLQATGKSVPLPAYCEQGIGQPGAFAFCALGIGQHVVVESQMSSSGSSNMGADVDRARNLALIGADYAMRVLSTTLAPGSTSP